MSRAADNTVWKAAQAAHRVLHHMVMEGRSAREFEADVRAAGPALFGVLNAFLRNVMEYVFDGSESVERIHLYLNQLQQAYPSELRALQPQVMAVFVQEQIGPGAPPPGQSGFQLHDAVHYQSRLIAEYAAKYEQFTPDRLELYLRGAMARYASEAA